MHEEDAVFHVLENMRNWNNAKNIWDANLFHTVFGDNSASLKSVGQLQVMTSFMWIYLVCVIHWDWGALPFVEGGRSAFQCEVGCWHTLKAFAKPSPLGFFFWGGGGQGFLLPWFVWKHEWRHSADIRWPKRRPGWTRFRSRCTSFEQFAKKSGLTRGKMVRINMTKMRLENVFWFWFAPQNCSAWCIVCTLFILHCCRGDRLELLS